MKKKEDSKTEREGGDKTRCAFDGRQVQSQRNAEGSAKYSLMYTGEAARERSAHVGTGFTENNSKKED